MKSNKIHISYKKGKKNYKFDNGFKRKKGRRNFIVIDLFYSHIHMLEYNDNIKRIRLPR